MRGFFVFLVLITIVMLGLAGCPKKEDASGTATPPTPTGGTTEDQSAATEGE